MMELLDLNEVFRDLHYKDEAGSGDRYNVNHDRINRRKQLIALFKKLGIEKKYWEYIHKYGEHYYIYRDDKAFLMEILSGYGKKDYKFKNIDKETKDPKENGKKNFILNGMCNLFGNLGVENEELSILRDKISEAMHYKENPLEGQLNDMAGRIALSVRDSIYKYRGTVTDEDMMCWIVNMKEDIIRYKEEKWDAVLGGISDARFYEKKETDRNTSIKNTEELLKEILYEVEETMRPEQRIFSDVWLENQPEGYKELLYAANTDEGKIKRLSDLMYIMKKELPDYEMNITYNRDRTPSLKILSRNKGAHVTDIFIYRDKSFKVNFSIDMDSQINPNYNGDVREVISAFMYSINNKTNTVESDEAIRGLFDAYNEAPRSEIYCLGDYRVMLVADRGFGNITYSIVAMHKRDINIPIDTSGYRNVNLFELNGSMCKEKHICCSGIIRDIKRYDEMTEDLRSINALLTDGIKGIKTEKLSNKCKNLLSAYKKRIEEYANSGLQYGRDIELLIEDEENFRYTVYADEFEYGGLIKLGKKYIFYGESIRVAGNAHGAIYLKHCKIF